MIRSVIRATGSCIPTRIIDNQFFATHSFFEKNGVPVRKSNDYLIEKLKEISGIHSRRYAETDQTTSQLAFEAGKAAIQKGAIDKETIDYIIVAHNFGEIAFGGRASSFVPCVATRVKTLLEIRNPDCVAYDLPFGCAGWVEAMIQANYFIRSGEVSRCLVIGADLISRSLDPHDRDSMLFSDGAGAVLLESSTETDRGILGHKTQTHAMENNRFIEMGSSLNPDFDDPKFLTVKMNGRKVYEFALTHVPALVKELLDHQRVSPNQIRKLLIHQANEKMDVAILERLFKLYNIDNIPDDIMPMTIGWLGNSSVATIPTMLDLISSGKLPGHSITAGDKIIFASVGAGMNLNAILYQV